MLFLFLVSINDVFKLLNFLVKFHVFSFHSINYQRLGRWRIKWGSMRIHNQWLLKMDDSWEWRQFNPIIEIWMLYFFQDCIKRKGHSHGEVVIVITNTECGLEFLLLETLLIVNNYSRGNLVTLKHNTQVRFL